MKRRKRPPLRGREIGKVNELAGEEMGKKVSKKGRGGRSTKSMRNS